MYSITEDFFPILYCWPDVVTLGNPFDAMTRFCLYSQCFRHFFPQGGCSEGLDAFRFFFKKKKKTVVGV